MPMKLPARLPKPPLEDIKDSELTGSRTLVLSATGPEADAAGHWQEFNFLIDGKTFNPNRIDQRVSWALSRNGRSSTTTSTTITSSTSTPTPSR